ncbi:MAG: autotransporter outer membrane beta-barrel domain-containing protein [Thermodesulfovibrionales bacterium]
MKIQQALLIVVMSLVLALPAVSAEFEHDLYGQVQSFTWNEYEGGRELLEEDGTLFGLGYAGRYTFMGFLTVRPRGEIFGGEIDYDGQTQDGTPASTDTEYAGIKTEGDVGFRWGDPRKATVEPFVGLGWRYWQRDIQDTVIDGGNGIPIFVSGVTENWSTLYGRLGVRGDIALSEKVRIFLEGTVKLSIDNQEEAEDVCTDYGCYDVDLEPGERVSYYAELGLKAAMFKVTAFYEGLRFSKSDPETIPGAIVWQPESEADIYGINLGVSF